MNTSEINENKKKYPWKSFAVFLALYIFGIVTYYPVLLAQSEIYIDILGESSAYTPTQFTGLALIQPILLGIVAIYFGHRYVEKAQLRSLIYERVEKTQLTTFNQERFTWLDSLPFIVIFSLGLALLNLGVDFIFQNALPGISLPTIDSVNIWQVLSNLFYSGFGQEMLLRWGVMTAVVYVLSARGESLSNKTYFIGLSFTAILYAFSQQSSIAGSGEFSALLWVRHLLVNGLDGLLYGWLYYKFHFEAAALSHLLTNAFIIGGTLLLGLFFT